MPAVGAQPFKLEINEDLCRVCRRCLAAEVCRGNAFITFRDESPFIDMSRCWGCLSCAIKCPFDAVIRSDYSQ